MVTFVSLFLWLMTDSHPVKVAVDPAVASVEVFLDGESIGVAIEPDWEVTCNFGERLRPHKLVAVARDEAGAELGHAVQLVNLPRANAEVEIVFEGGTPEAPTMLRVITENSERLEPLAIFVSFDGLLLQKNGGRRFRLPPYDSRRVHIVSAEAHFPDGITARRDLTFGGTYGGRVATELTAVPVTLEKRRELTTQELQGLFRARGEVLTVAAVEREGGRVYVVRDHGAWPMLRRSGFEMDRRYRTARRDFQKKLASVAQDPGAIEEIPPQKDRFYLVVPNPTHSRGLALYPIVQPFSIKRWGLPWLAAHILSIEAALPGQQLAEAVAVAGLRAAADGCPRTVVLILGADTVDVSNSSPASVRDYLRALRVPLVVWSTEGGDHVTPWGVPEAVDDVGPLGKASKRLMNNLHRQWIVWVEGHHLPNEIELAENDRGIRLAG
jgi:hypothetical protein